MIIFLVNVNITDAQSFDKNGVIATETITFYIENMTCPVCPIIIKEVLKNIPGVHKVVINLKTKIVTIIFNPKQISIEPLIALITQAGYVVILLPAPSN